MTKKREYKPGDKVEVYRNLHKDCFSVRKKGMVVGYIYDDGTHYRSTEIYLTDVTFVVQPAGRKKVLKEQRKNVHAFVRGIVTDTGGLHREGIIRRCIKKVTYNPYTMETFQDISGNLIIEAKEVYISNGVVHI
jgi:hypothetical protein